MPAAVRTSAGSLVQHMQPQSYEYCGEYMSVRPHPEVCATAAAHVAMLEDWAT